MKRLFNFLSRKKRISKLATETVTVKPQSQQGSLTRKMISADIQHDETVVANIEGVRIERTNAEGTIKDVGDLTMFFCGVDKVEVVKRLTPGDNLHIPKEVKLHSFNLPSDFKAGTYNLNKVMLHANGVINVTATGKTTIELVNY